MKEQYKRKMTWLWNTLDRIGRLFGEVKIDGCDHSWQHHADTEMYYEARMNGETGVKVPMWNECTKCGKKEDVQTLY